MMRRATAGALLACVLATAAIARPTPELHQLVRVTLRTPSDLRDLLALDLDVTENVRATYADVVVTRRGADALTQRGFLYRVVDADMHATFLRNVGAAPDLGGFHNYEEALADMQAVHAAHPTITSDVVSIGRSVEGRDIWAIQVSTTPGITDPTKPEVLCVGNHHARELISVEIPLDILHTLTDGYVTNGEATDIVNKLQTWIIPTLNPDGLVYVANVDEFWRKNRRNNGGGTFGVDLNRNYSFKWGIDNIGSSGNSGSDTYRGTAPFSEPETAALRDFAAQHRFVRNIDWHSYGREYIYPWGYANNIYTSEDLTFRVAADSLARANGYDTLIGWELYLTNGEADDWWWGDTVVKPRAYSMTPEVGTSFHPPDSQIAQLVGENRGPALYWYRSAFPADTSLADVRLSTHAITVSRGGLLSFTYDVVNTSGATQTWKQWDEVVLPNGQATPKNPVGGFKTLTLAPGEVRTLSFSKTIPSTAGTGTFTWTSRVAAAAPWPVLAEDVLTFTITTANGRPVVAAASDEDDGSWLTDAHTDVREPSVTVVAHARPVRVTLAGAADRIEVIDARGRVVARASTRQGGTRTLAEWDGRLHTGAPAPRGIYLFRSPAGAEARVLLAP